MSKRRFDFDLDVTHVEVVKQTHFTVTPIANIKEWRLERRQIEEAEHKEAQTRFKQARERAILAVKGELQVNILKGIDDLESAYMDARKDAKTPPKLTWDQIKAKMDDWDAKNEAKREEYEPTLLERLKSFF